MTDARPVSENPSISSASPAPSASAWTTRRLLAWVSEAFAKRNLDSPKLSAEILLSHVLGVERLRLYMEPDREAGAGELEKLRGLVGRALKDEPVQYLTGEGWFFGLPFAVDRRVLVPRPCTEVIVETVLQRARRGGAVKGEGVEKKIDAAERGLRILDLCTGSGCVAVALAKHLKGAEVVASDLSGDALDVARRNAERHGVAVEFRAGDLFEPLREGEAFDFIVSNPPYIPDAEWAEVPANVKKHEPVTALRGGPDGLDLVRSIIQQAPRWLTPGGLLMVEVAASRAQAALKLAEDADLYADGWIVKDLEGLERFVVAAAR